jgi:hypothetical protein
MGMAHMTNTETAKPERNLTETCFAFQQQISDRNLRNLLPIGSGGEVSPHPRYRSVALRLLRCALLIPPTHRTSVRTNTINTRTDDRCEELHHGHGNTSSAPQLIDNRLPGSRTSRCGLVRSDQQSTLLLAIDSNAIVLSRLIAIAWLIITRVGMAWEEARRNAPVRYRFRSWGLAPRFPDRGGVGANPAPAA